MRAGRRTGAILLLLAGCAAEASRPATAARVELAGGSNPGVYLASSVSPACARDLLGPGSWGVQLTDWTGPKAGLRSLQLVVPDRERPEEFYLGLVFGDFFAGTVHEIEARPLAPARKGRGRVRFVPQGEGGTITVTGSTDNKVTITASIACVPEPDREGETP